MRRELNFKSNADRGISAFMKPYKYYMLHKCHTLFATRLPLAKELCRPNVYKR